MAITTPDAVPGEVIEAAWGDAVRTDLTTLDGTKLNLAGGTMTGPLQAGDITTGAGWSLRGAGPQLGQFASHMRGPTAAALDANIGLIRNVSPASDVGGRYINFERGGTSIGSINVGTGGTNVVYLTTSDPRTKTAPPPTREIGDAAQRAQTLGRGAWRGQHLDADTGQPVGPECDFVSSHDIEAVAPYAVTGDRDACDDTGAPVYQQVSYAELVPLLFAALANALDRIDALEAAGV